MTESFFYVKKQVQILDYRQISRESQEKKFKKRCKKNDAEDT